ncbi:MAG: hypothetical protein JOZ51_07130, partial [Chloroflexi bacterium]|nr:hypothetical protein [Chloroflexota bacterium]
LLMWVPGGMVYLLGIIGLLARWYAMPEEDAPTLSDLNEPGLLTRRMIDG